MITSHKYTSLQPKIPSPPQKKNNHPNTPSQPIQPLHPEPNQLINYVLSKRSLIGKGSTKNVYRHVDIQGHTWCWDKNILCSKWFNSSKKSIKMYLKFIFILIQPSAWLQLSYIKHVNLTQVKSERDKTWLYLYLI